MRSFLQDLHFALRQLRNAPGFAFAAICTLGLGIGVNAAMFSVIDQVLLHRMPFPKSGEVVQMGAQSESGTFNSTSLPDIQDWQARSHSFQQIGYFLEQIPTLGGTANPKLVADVVTSANLFDLLQVRPMLGRGFLQEDGRAGHEHVVLLPASVWREMYHADPGIVGRAVPINGVPYTVIGVMPQGFNFPANTGDDAIWTPLPIDEKALQDRGSGALSVIGRLRDGVTIDNATREMNAIHAQLRQEYPKDETINPVRVQSYAEVMLGAVRPAILALDGAVLAVWLIACANVAGLLLAKANGRRREIALRAALGAPRGRLVRQFLTESLLLSLAGGAVGLGVAAVALRVLKQYLAKAILFGDQIHIDMKVCVYLLAASCVSAVLFGLLPALQASNTPAQEGLRQGTAGAGTSRRQAMWRDALVIGEIALTLALLVAAGLMVRTLLSLRHTQVGFVADQVTTGQIYLPNQSLLFTGPAASVGAASLIQTFYTPLLYRLRALPGIQAAGLTTVRPLEGNWDFNMTVEVAGRPKPEHSALAYAQVRATSAEYFRTMGIRLLAGRFFSSEDAADAPPMAIVNRAFVRRFFANESPLGHQIRYNDAGPRQWATIVGIVEDSPQKTLGQMPLPEVHYNLTQLVPGDDLYPILGAFYMNVAIRSPLDSETVSRELQRAVHDLEPGAALDRVESMQQVVDDSLGNQVLAARLLGLFSLAGLAIAVAGIYGLLAYSVSLRTRELGVRLALGAQRESVLWLVLRHALVLLGIGITLGAVMSGSLERVLTAFLTFKLHVEDGFVVLGVGALLSVCGLAASYLPARRAARIDPVVALRMD
jgi:predicted permease